MIKRILWIVIIFLAIAIGCYPAIYFLIDRQFGLLATKEIAVLESIGWNIAFYVHIVLGGIALLIGWLQFSVNLRERYVQVHRSIGIIYVLSVFLSASTGLYIAVYATGGIIAKAGFAGLGIVWLLTTLQAYRVILKKEIRLHQTWMIYSYASCLAAVTLRIWLPILINVLHDFIPAYRIVAWLCWVPNLMVAFLLTRNLNATQVVTVRTTNNLQ
jgi:Predicted membrane protein (DUF2306)